MTSWVLAAVLIGQASGVSAPAVQPATEIAFSAGRVSLSAFDAPVADVLAAWARAGNVELAGVEYLGIRRVSLRLTNTSESDALRAIVGAAGWYTTVARETPGPSESSFQRIVIRREAATAATDAAAPESRYTYYSDPAADAMAQALMAPPAARPKNVRPPDVDPESFYQYDAVAADAPDTLIVQPTSVTRQPVHPTIGVDPEVLYSYSPTPESVIPIAISSFIPPTPALDPEARFAYDATPEIPEYMLPHGADGGIAIPSVPAVEGLIGLRLPGRVVFRIVNEG